MTEDKWTIKKSQEKKRLTQELYTQKLPGWGIRMFPYQLSRKLKLFLQDLIIWISSGYWGRGREIKKHRPDRETLFSCLLYMPRLGLKPQCSFQIQTTSKSTNTFPWMKKNAVILPTWCQIKILLFLRLMVKVAA